MDAAEGLSLVAAHAVGEHIGHELHGDFVHRFKADPLGEREEDLGLLLRGVVPVHPAHEL